jgi:Protein of unknown function (DUF3263)
MDPEPVEQVDPAKPAEPTSVRSEPLSPREAEMLAFERQWWKFAGAKEQAIRELFDLTATRYYQVLNTLIERPEALEHDAMLVKRLRRTREARRRSGSARSLDAHG